MFILLSMINLKYLETNSLLSAWIYIAWKKNRRATVKATKISSEYLKFTENFFIPELKPLRVYATM